MHVEQLHCFGTVRRNQSSGIFALFRIAYLSAVLCVSPLTNEGLYAGPLTETQLTFYPLGSQSFQRDFGFVSGALSNGPISFIRHDLVDSSGRGVIPASEIAIEPLSAAAPLAGANFLFHVTSKGSPRAGVYSGKLEVNYPSAATATIQTAQLDLICHSSLPPVLEADSVSPLVLNATKLNALEEFFTPRQPVFSSARFQLQQTVDSPAEILAVYPSTFRSAKGISLSSNSLTVNPMAHVALSGREGRNFEISLAGALPPAGEYNGTIIANVRGQSALIKVPVKVQIKHGWLLPLAVLIAGLVVASLLPWWNQAGKEMSEILEKTMHDLASLPKLRRLQTADRARVAGDLEDVLRAIDADESIDDVRKLFQQARARMDAATTATNTLLSDLDALRTQVGEIPEAKSFKQQMRSLLDDLAAGLEKGIYASLDDARDAKQSIKNEITSAQDAALKWNALTPVERDTLKEKWNAATTAAGLAGVVAPQAGVAAAAAGSASPPTAALPSSVRYTPDHPRFGARQKLLLIKFAVAAFLWLLMICVGMITLYSAVPAFGSDPKDYLALFFWGATFESLRGQVLSLSGLKGALKL